MLIAGTTNAPISKNKKSEISDPTTLGWPSASPDALFCASPASLAKNFDYTRFIVAALQNECGHVVMNGFQRSLVGIDHHRSPVDLGTFARLKAEHQMTAIPASYS